MIGTTLSHFRITAKLGEGGMGEVYRAEDTKLGRGVAIKVLPEAVATDPERLARFEREAKLIGSLKNPYISTVYGLEEVEGRRFLAMELVEGQEAGKQSDIWAFGCVLYEMLAGKRAFPVGIMGDAEVEPAWTALPKTLPRWRGVCSGGASRKLAATASTKSPTRESRSATHTSWPIMGAY